MLRSNSEHDAELIAVAGCNHALTNLWQDAPMSAARRKLGQEQRTALRVPLLLPGRISVPADGVILHCTVKDLAVGGAGLSYEAVAPRPELVGVLEIGEFGTFHGVTIRGVGRTRGFRFASGEATRNGLLKKL